jgi:hypothetical protein
MYWVNSQMANYRQNSLDAGIYIIDKHKYPYLQQIKIVLYTRSSIKFYSILCMCRVGQLQIRCSVYTGNYIMDKHNIKWKTNYRQAVEEITY